MKDLLTRLDPLLPRLPTQDVFASEHDLLAQRCGNWFTCATKVTEGRFREERYGSDIQDLVHNQEALTSRKLHNATSSGVSVANVFILPGVRGNIQWRWVSRAFAGQIR